MVLTHKTARKKTLLRKITEWNPMGNRARGRPKSSWRDQVEEDIKKVKIENWRKQITDRNKWRKLVEKSKTYKQFWRKWTQEKCGHHEKWINRVPVGTATISNEIL